MPKPNPYRSRQLWLRDTLFLHDARARAWLTIAILVLGRSASAQSPPVANNDTLRLTLEQARALAFRENPALRAIRLGSNIAKAELQQASVLFRTNPTIDVLAGGPGTEIGVDQEIEIAGQRAARRAGALAGVKRAEAGIRDTIRVTLATVDRTYFRLFSATQKSTLADEGQLLTQRLADAARRQLEAGKISKLEYNLSAVEEGRARARSLAATREREQFSSELRELLGLPPTKPVAPAAPSPLKDQPIKLDVDSLTRIALARRPDLVERAAAARQARALASLARREALPNLSLRASSEPLEGNESRVLRPGIGLSLPIFNRNSGEAKARRLEAQMIDLEGAALASSIRIEVARAVRAYESAAAEAAILESTVLAPARENRRLLELAYREGKIGLPVLLLVRAQVIDAEAEYWDAWLNAREAITDLNAAVGGDFPSAISGMENSRR